MPAMRFELTEALIDDILFSMEDQGSGARVDTRKGMVVSLDYDGGDEGRDEEGRYIDLPAWSSADGFRLMERFTTSVRSPPIQERLIFALNRGRGVFRAFKDALAAYPETEKRWFAFKDRAMKREILDWYNGLREEWGLERVGTEPEETADLVLEDFRIRDFRAEDAPAARALRRDCLREAPAPPEAAAGVGWPGDGGAGGLPDLALTAESVGGEFAGYAAAALAGRTLRVDALEVRPDYRGLGIGEALVTTLLERAVGKADEAYLDLPARAEGFSRVLAREGFTAWATRYRVEIGGRGGNRGNGFA